MSVRGVISGVAGSAAVAVVAAFSVGMTHAAADPTPARAPAYAEVAPASQPAPSLRPAAGPAQVKPTWLQRLLSRRDPPMEAPPRKS